MKIDENEIIYCSRGSSALYAILEAIKPEYDTILLPVNICEIVIPVVQASKYNILFYDVDPISGNANLECISKINSPDKCVVLVVHNFGIPVEIEAIMEWAKPKKHFIIEDICNSLGAKIGKYWVGTFGDASILSFGASKIIANGIGGGVYVKSSKLHEKIERFVDGFPKYDSKYIQIDIGLQSQIRKIRETKPTNSLGLLNNIYQNYVKSLIYKMPLSEQQKVKEQFKLLDSNVEHRENLAKHYESAISNPVIMKPIHKTGQVYWRYNIRVKENRREVFLDFLRKNEIWASSWYPPIAHMFFNEKQFHPTKFKGSNKFASEVVNLFVDSRISEKKVIQSCDVINDFNI